jgi:hypothetical protein
LAGDEWVAGCAGGKKGQDGEESEESAHEGRRLRAGD